MTFLEGQCSHLLRRCSLCLGCSAWQKTFSGCFGALSSLRVLIPSRSWHFGHDRPSGTGHNLTLYAQPSRW